MEITPVLVILSDKQRGLKTIKVLILSQIKMI